MYPAKNLAGLTEQDFQNNIHHIEGEGFRKGKPILVSYYDWLNIYEGNQSGGSHHTAMLVYQLIEQKRKYFREAIIKHYKIDINPIINLTKEYYIFVTSAASSFDQYDSNYIDNQLKKISQEVYYIKISFSANDAFICLIPKDKLIVENRLFKYWYKKNINKKIIPLLSLIENTLAYCTKPYLHEIRQVYLGDPLRRNDIKVQRLKLKTIKNYSSTSNDITALNIKENQEVELIELHSGWAKVKYLEQIGWLPCEILSSIFKNLDTK